jgi:hypothetical protein
MPAPLPVSVSFAIGLRSYRSKPINLCGPETNGLKSSTVCPSPCWGVFPSIAPSSLLQYASGCARLACMHLNSSNILGFHGYQQACPLCSLFPCKTSGKTPVIHANHVTLMCHMAKSKSLCLNSPV